MGVRNKQRRAARARERAKARARTAAIGNHDTCLIEGYCEEHAREILARERGRRPAGAPPILCEPVGYLRFDVRKR
jgi:hypothetical protein